MDTKQNQGRIIDALGIKSFVKMGNAQNVDSGGLVHVPMAQEQQPFAELAQGS